MKISELKNIIEKKEQITQQIYFSIITKDKYKTISLLNEIKEMGYAAFVRTNEFGTEICVTDFLGD